MAGATNEREHDDDAHVISDGRARGATYAADAGLNACLLLRQVLGTRTDIPLHGRSLARMGPRSPKLGTWNMVLLDVSASRLAD